MKAIYDLKRHPQISIEPFDPAHLDAIVALSLRAWAPVFVSIEQAMDPEVYRAQHPDWRVDQKKAVEGVCADETMHVWVALDDDTVAGFVAVHLHAEWKMGEIHMIAVDPDSQQRGIGVALSEFALARMTEAGMTTAMVQTGGDPGHAPARRTYEKTGFRVFPVAQYFKKL